MNLAIHNFSRNREVVRRLQGLARASKDSISDAVLARMTELADIAAKKRRNKKKDRASSPDIALRREYYKYQDIKGLFIGSNLVFSWINDFIATSAMGPYLFGTTNQFSAVEVVDKKILDQYAQDSKSLKIVTPMDKGDKTGKKPTDHSSRIDAGSVLVKLSTPKLALQVNPLANMPESSSALGDSYQRQRAGINNFEDALKEFDKQIGALIGVPNYKFGRTLKLVKHDTRGRSIVVNMKPMASPLTKFSEFASEKGESFTSKIQKAVGLGMDIETSNIPKASAQMMEFEIAIDEDSCKLTPSPAAIDTILADPVLGRKLEEGTLTFEEYSSVSIPYFTMTLHVGVYIRYPLRYALWATCVNKVEDFNAALFMDLHNTRVTRAVDTKKQGQARTPTWMSGMNQVRDEVRRYEKEFDHRFKPRVNEDGFALTKSATPIWVPETDNTDEFMQRMKNRHDRTTGEVRPPTSAGLKNYPVFTDWKHSKFSYCNDSGFLNIIDLSGCSAMPPAFIYRSLEQELHVQKTYCGNFWTQHANKLDNDNKLFDEVAHKFENSAKHPNTRYTGVRNWSAAFNTLTSSPAFMSLNYMDAFGEWDDKEKEEIDKLPRAQYPYQYLILDILRAGAWKLLQLVDKRDKHDIAFLTLIEEVRFGAFCLTKYSKNSAKIIEAYQAMKESNRLADVDTDDFIPEIANLPGLDSLQPHQIEVVGALAKKVPLYAIIDVAAGGGKTIIAISEIILMLDKGLINRPIIMTKDNLVAEFMTEITTVSKGQVNGVPITAATVEQHTRNFDIDAKKFVQWVKSFPKNTIFVAGYNFAKKADSTNEDKSLFRNENNSAIIRNRNEIVYGNYIGSRISERVDGQSMTAYKPLETYPMSDLLVMCDFDYVNCDEAHYIKETDAQVTQAVNNVMATAKYRRWMSGTIVTNTAIDLVGIMSTLGVFGTKEDFKKQYMQGRALKPGMASVVLERIKERAGIITKRRKDWAYIMPDIHEEFIPAYMTPLQQKFYKDLLEQAMARFEKEYKKILGKDAPDGVEVKDDGEEDDVTSEEAERLLAATLTRLEVFVGAPDEDKPRGADALEDGVNAIHAFKNLVPKPGPDDLVSPKVKMLNKVLAAHFHGVPLVIDGEDTGITKDDSQDKNGGPANKVVVLSYNKPLSRHVMRHLAPEFRKVAIRYVASRTEDDAGLDLMPGREALEKFRKDPNVKILVADVASMTEGFNLQMASRLIELQTVWSPGKMEQARARVVRPDPRSFFLRDNVSVSVIAAMVDNDDDLTSVDVAKFCRIVTKVISKARLDYEEDPSWRREMANNPTLDLPGGGLKMSPKAIRELRPEDMIPYRQAYQEFTKWEEQQFHKSREKLKKKLEAKHGKTLTMQDVRKLALEPVVHAKNIEGSKKVYCPYIYGQKIYDPIGLDLQSLLQFDSDKQSSEDDKEDAEDELVVEDGTPVWTQYGPGRVSGKPRTMTLYVDVPGLKTLRQCTKGTTFVPSTEEGRRKLENLLRQLGDAGAPTVDDDGRPIPQRDLTKFDLDSKVKFSPKILKPKQLPEPEDETEDENDDGDKQSEIEDGMNSSSLDVSISPLVVNSAPALLFVGNPDDPQERNVFLQEFSKRRWVPVRDFIGIKVPNYRAMDAWIKALNEKYRIKSDRLQYLTVLSTQLKTHQDKLFVEDEHLTGLKAFKNFYNHTHTDLPPKNKVDGRWTVKPWLTTFKNSVFLSFDVRTHHPTLLTELHKLYTRNVAQFVSGKNGGEAFEPKLRDHWAIKFVTGVFDAQKAIKEIDVTPGFSVLDLDDVIEECSILAKRKTNKTLSDDFEVDNEDRVGTPGRAGSPGKTVVNKKSVKPGVKTAVKPGVKKKGFQSQVKKQQQKSVTDRLNKITPTTVKRSKPGKPSKPSKPSKPPSKPKKPGSPGKFGKR